MVKCLESKTREFLCLSITCGHENALEHYDNNEEVAMSDFNGLVSCVNMVYQNHVKEQVYMQNIYI